LFPDEVILSVEKILACCGISALLKNWTPPLSELKTARQGPRANPARRFAVWALKEHTRLTHREIGVLLDMSVNQASKVATRFNSSTESLNSWVNELTIYMSSGGV
jgi:hypothetical protein